MVAVEVRNNKNPSWRRWFRRTNVYIAEYVLMLALVAGFIGVLVSLWFSLFDMLYNSYPAVSPTVSQIGALLVVGPAAFWMYARVTGQEMIQPELYTRKSRTVFLSIWMVFAVLGLVSMVAAIVATFVGALFGLGGDFGGALVTNIIPGVLAVATIAFGLFMVVKRVSRTFVMIAALVLAVMAAVLLVANTAMVIARKDSVPDDTTTPLIEPDENCTFRRYYVDKQCSYEDYQDYLRSSSGSMRRHDD